MKTIIALGLVILSFLLVMALRHTAASLYSVPKGKPASAESQQIFRISHTLRVTPQAQPVHAILLAVIEAETDPDRRSEALERAVKSVSDADLPAMLDSLSHDNSPAAAELSQLLVRRWAETNAPAAAAWATQLPESSARRDALEQVAIAWANTDLPAAASWVHTLSEGDSKQAATLDLSYEATRTEPIAAIELVRTLPPTSERNDLLVHAISQWAGADSTTAAAWATKVSDPNLRERLVAAVAVASAKHAECRGRTRPYSGFRCATLGAEFATNRGFLGLTIPGYPIAQCGGAKSSGHLDCSGRRSSGQLVARSTGWFSA